ncbi:AAA family ATPase [Sphingomonas sp. MMS12-HWE2-04]|uniref:AAA family ATPase n=1 Tax=Sphingomonas sp. MMS12-HWE2-04 TaxID=3234199 RepID=UPI00384BC804
MAANAAKKDIDAPLLTRPGLDMPALYAAAEQIAAQHKAAPRADGAAFRAALAQRIDSSQRKELDRLSASLVRRGDAGRVRRINGAPADILYDLADPVALLLRQGRAPDANLLANRYLDIQPQGATGWALLPLFVALHAAPGEPAQAEAVLAAAPPQLLVIAGLSGTGKSVLAGLLGHRLGRAPGARILRSDVFRKRLMGLAPEQRLPPKHYTRRSDAETYEAMFESADDHLACGSSVILDGTFMSRSERDVAEAIADRARVPFTGIWLEAPERDRIARVAARRGDASDATEAVVREQSRRGVGEIHWHRIRTNRPTALIVAAARAALGRT